MAHSEGRYVLESKKIQETRTVRYCDWSDTSASTMKL